VNTKAKHNAIFKSVKDSVHIKRKKVGKANHLEQIKKSFRASGQAHLIKNASLKYLDIVDRQADRISIGTTIEVVIKGRNSRARQQIETYFALKNYVFKYSAVYPVTRDFKFDYFLAHQNQVVNSLIATNKNSATPTKKVKKTPKPQKKIFKEDPFSN